MTLAELSLKRPVTVIMFFVSMVVIGLIAAVRLPLELFPDIDIPFMAVNLPYPNSTPEEVEREITRPVEEALSTLTGIQHMNSTSRADGTDIFLRFKWGQDVTIKAVEAREKIDAVRSTLPSDLQRYFVRKFSSSDQAVVNIRIASDRDLTNAYELIDKKLKRPLERLPGVAKVGIEGVAPNEVQIEISADRLSTAGISLNDLYKRLSDANFSSSGGLVREGDLRYRVQPMGEWRNLEAIRSFPINDKGLKLADVATVALNPGRLNYARHLDLRPAIAVDVFKERNANLVDVSRAVNAEMQRISKDPELQGIQLYFLQDSGAGVVSSLRELGEAGLIGTLLSILVLFFFLRDWASTLMVSLAIPICLVMTLGCMYFFGITLNVLSMMGLLLAVGMLVDNAVVVVESIYQFREKYPDKPWYSAVQGTQTVGMAIAAGTFASIAVFLPNIFGAKNQISIFLTQVAVAMTIAHLASWLVAVSLIPMLASKLPSPKFITRDSFISRLQARYTHMIDWTLRNRRWTVVGTMLLVLLSLVPIAFTTKDMFPQGESRQLFLQYDLNAVYRLPDVEKSIHNIEVFLQQHKQEFDIKSTYSRFDEAGQAFTSIQMYDDNRGVMRTIKATLQSLTGIKLFDDDHTTRSAAAIMDDIRNGLPKIPIGSVGFDQQKRGNSDGLQLSLVGDSSKQLHELIGAVIPVLQAVPGLRDVRSSENNNASELAVHVDRDRAQNFGFSAQQVAQYVAIALRGINLKEFRGGEKDVPVWLRFANADTQRIDDLSDYKLRRADGSMIPLMAMVDLKTQAAASSVQRENRQTSLAIKTNLADGVTMDDARKGIESAMKSVVLPAGYGWTFGTSFDESDDAGKQMLLNLVLALVLVYVVMASMFESLIFPAAIMTTFVFSIFGVFWLFWLSGTTFSIMAFIGVLILMGVVVNNGIVMIVHVNHLRQQGMSRNEALVQGARDRMRPILMTMGTAILGMVPLCFSTNTMGGGGGPPYYPMARAIAGGLIFSTLVTIVVLPTIYSMLDDMRTWTRNLIQDARKGRAHRASII